MPCRARKKETLRLQQTSVASVSHAKLHTCPIDKTLLQRNTLLLQHSTKSECTILQAHGEGRFTAADHLLRRTIRRDALERFRPAKSANENAHRACVK